MKQKSSWQLVTTSLLLVLAALVSITAATAAWMTIADRTRVNTMRLDVTTGANLRFDLDAHESFDDYVKVLTFEDIAARIAQEQHFRPQDNPLTPVTTSDCVHFRLEDGTAAKKEYYLEFTLHFMATTDMVVHLTANGPEGTAITSDTPGVKEAMRLSFTAEAPAVYDPGMGGTSRAGYGGKVFGLTSSDQYDDSSALFTLKEGVDMPVTVRVWLEGTDKACTDTLRGANYSIRLRFVGTDENGTVFADSTRRTGGTLPKKERN